MSTILFTHPSAELYGADRTLLQIVEAIAEHRAWLESSGMGVTRRRLRARSEIQGIALAALQARFAGVGGAAALEDLSTAVAEGRTDAFSAADQIVAAVSG